VDEGAYSETSGSVEKVTIPALRRKLQFYVFNVEISDSEEDVKRYEEAIRRQHFKKRLKICSMLQKSNKRSPMR